MNGDLKKLGTAPSDEDILSNCVIPYVPGDKPLHQFTPEQQDFITLAKRKSLACLSALRATGEHIMFVCIPGTSYPDPRMVVEKFSEMRRSLQSKFQGEEEEK